MRCRKGRRVSCALQCKHGRGKILCRRLEWEQGAVSSRVASLLRSAEAKPLFYRFVRHCRTFLSPGQWRCVPPTQAASSCAALAAALAYWYASQPRSAALAYWYASPAICGHCSSLVCAALAYLYASPTPSTICGHRTVKAPYPVRSAKLSTVSSS